MIYRFGTYELDGDAGELRKAGTPVAIQPKPFELLRVLIEARDRIVPLDELFDRLWPDTAVTPSSLTRAVSHARRAIGDTHRGEAIKSHARRGYRFCVDVAEGDAPAPAAKSPAAAATPHEGPPFVGRDAVLAQLVAAYEAAATGSPRIVLLEGAAGVGKTRLTQIFCDALAARDAGILRAQAREGEDVPAFWVWAQILRQLAGEESLRDELEALARHSSELGALVPELDDGARRRAGNANEQDRFLFFDATTRAIASFAAQRPTLLLLEDLHWAESGSLRLLEHLVHEIGATPLLIVVTARDEARSDHDPVARTLATLRRLDPTTPIKLGGLSRGEVATLLERVIGRTPPVDLVSELTARTEGVPLYLREAIRLLEERGALEDPERIRAGELALPSESLGLISRAFESLAGPAEALMGAAAVLGREFTLAALAETAGLERADALDALDEAIAAGVVEEDPDSTAAFRFTHALYQEAAVERLPAGQRARLHLRAAERLERRHADDLDSVIEALARHHHRAIAVGDPERAWSCAMRAGAVATRLLAWEQAAQHYHRADEALEHLEEPDAERCFETWLALGEAFLASGDRRRRQQVLDRALDLARRHERPDVFARAAILYCDTSEWAVPDDEAAKRVDEALERLTPEQRDTADRARLLTRQVYRHIRYEPLRGEGGAREAAALARATGDDRAIQEALYVLCFLLAGPDFLEERSELAREMVGAADRSALEAETIIAAIDVASDALMRGDAEAAYEWRLEAGRLAGGAPPPLMGWHCQVFDAGRAFMEGRLDDGRKLSETALTLGRRAGHPYARGIHNSFLAIDAWENARFDEVLERMLPFLGVDTAPLHWVRGMAARAALRLGDEARARTLYEEALLHGVDGIPRGIRFTRSLIELAHAAVDLGDTARSADFLRALDGVGDQHGVLPVPVCYGGPASHARARLLAGAGRIDDALDAFEEARDRARALRARPSEARILADEARCLAENDRPGHDTRSASAERIASKVGIQLFG